MNLENSKIFVKEVEPLKIHVGPYGIQKYCRNELIVLSQMSDGRISVDILPCADGIIKEYIPVSYQNCGHEFEDIDTFNDIDALRFFNPEEFDCFDDFLSFIEAQVNAIETYIVFADEYTKSKLNRSLYVQLIGKLHNIDNRNQTERFYDKLKKDCKSGELEETANCVKAFFGITFNS